MAAPHASKTSIKSTTAKKTASKRASSGASRAKAAAQNAIELLTQDHRAVEKLFKSFEKAKGDGEKQKLAEQICVELKVHAQIEEEIFYPAADRALEDEEMVDEALVEHASAKKLIAEIETMRAGQDMFDAKVKVLSEQIDHHVKEEEKELFPACKKADLDLEGLGERLKQRKMELMNQLTGGRAGAH
jgi:hemerythrin superfamily protein